MFDTVAASVCRDILEGYNGTIMAYGQTGAGKTFTLTNKVLNLFLFVCLCLYCVCSCFMRLVKLNVVSVAQSPEGLIPRAVRFLFETIEADKEHDYTVLCTNFLSLFPLRRFVCLFVEA